MKLDTSDESDELKPNIYEHQNHKCYLIDNYSDDFQKNPGKIYATKRT